jgi:hypothetical protein
MKHIHYIYIGALAFLIACSSEERITTDSNEKPSGPIVLSAGIVEGSSKATTRTAPTYQALTTSTQLALQVNGNWKHGDTTTPITKTTTATIGTASETNNVVNFTAAETLYWDDYGTADPDNATVGRTEGLTIYGAAINGKTIAPTVSNWSVLSWEVPTNQTTSGSTPADKDLLISNNVKTGTSDGTYKFTEKTSGKLLKFTHALSKITVVLTAGDGFVDKNGDASLDFANDPEVLLTSNVANSSTNTEWACTKGNINITSGEVTLTGTSLSGDPAVITMWQASSTGHIVTKEALVMPGSQFTSDGAIIARINADGNIYYVTAQKIRAKITGESKVTEAGKNYIINVTVNKTDIVVTATVADWTNVTAAEDQPVINISGDLGGSGSALDANTFSFYRSTSFNTGYGTASGSYFTEESVVTHTTSPSDTWTMDPILYWPNHNTHYQFRCVWPRTVTTDEDGILSNPRIETATHSTKEYQVIKVQNVAYTANSFPSDLMIARPNVEDEPLNCGNNETGHAKKNLYSEGICAREGNINLTFNYMMSQVEVNLTTTTGDDQVRLTNAVVEIINVNKTGDVKLGDRGVIPTGSTTSYTLDPVTGDGNENKRLSAVVPQPLTFTTALASGNVQFRITITNEDTSKDIYYADIYPILESGKSSRVAPNGKWESGVHYVYNLKLSKTEIKVTASLANWTTVTASQDIWF